MTRVMRGSHFVRCFISISSRRLRPISTLFPYTTLFRSSTKPNQELHGANHNPRVGGSSPSSGTREASCNSDPSHSPTASADASESPSGPPAPLVRHMHFCTALLSATALSATHHHSLPGV